MHRKGFRLAAIAISVSAIWGTAAAANGLATTKITIKGKGLTFSGKVTANNPLCVSGRKVTLHRTNGNVLGSYTTHSSGTWKITASGSAGISLGHFYATVAQRKVGAYLVCKAGKSKTIPFHQ